MSRGSMCRFYWSLDVCVLGRKLPPVLLIVNYFPGLPHLRRSKVTYCLVDRLKTVRVNFKKTVQYSSAHVYSPHTVVSVVRSYFCCFSHIEGDRFDSDCFPLGFEFEMAMLPSFTMTVCLPVMPCFGSVWWCLLPPSLPLLCLSPAYLPPLAGFPMHAKSTVNVGSGDPPRWSSKVNMAPAVH